MTAHTDEPDDRVRLMGHLEHHDIDHAVREVKVYVPVVVLARIAELVRAGTAPVLMSSETASLNSPLKRGCRFMTRA